MDDVRSTFLVGNTSTCTVVPRRCNSVGRSTLDAHILHRHSPVFAHAPVIGQKVSSSRIASDLETTIRVLFFDHILATSKRMPQGARVYGYPTCPSPITCDLITQRTGGTRTIHRNPTYCTTIIGYASSMGEKDWTP
jgi:hypothetical protein